MHEYDCFFFSIVNIQLEIVVSAMRLCRDAKWLGAEKKITQLRVDDGSLTGAQRE